MGTVRQAIAGQFLAGELTAGETRADFAPPDLDLIAWSFALTQDETITVSFPRPKLLLEGKAYALDMQTFLSAAKPYLELTAREVEAAVPLVVAHERPLLLLTARPTVLVNEVTLVFGRPQLELLARAALGLKPGLIPTVPVDWTLVPTVPGEATLTPTVVEEGYLTPTVEVTA